MLVPLFSSKGQNLNFVFEGKIMVQIVGFNWKYKVLVYLFKVKLSKYIKIMLITFDYKISEAAHEKRYWQSQ
jgi:hypothetical protein